MHIGIDFDNTLGDFVSLLRDVTLQRTGFDIRRAREAQQESESVESLIHAAIGKERFESFLAEIHETILTLEMPPQPGAVEVAQRLAVRHELVVLTARNDRETDAVRRWLERHEIPVAGLVGTDRRSKAPFAAEHGLAVHLDDSAQVFADFGEAHPTVPALLAHPMNATAPRAAHWRPVEDWLAFEGLVRTLEREQDGAGG